MEKIINGGELSAIAEQLLEEGKYHDEIVASLLETGATYAEATDITNTVRSNHYTRQRSKGLPLLAIGALLCIIGCLMAVAGFDSGTAFHVGLYGMTGAGASSIIAGLMFVLG
jgi:hypothetical protein